MVLGPGEIDQEIDQERHERLKARLMARARREAEMGILGGLSEAEARIAELEQALARLRGALTVLYELNESGNVGGAVYEEAMDLAMDALRDTENLA